MGKMQPTPRLSDTIGKNLRRLISQYEPMSQRELAAEIGIPTMVLNRAINGASTPAADAIINIAGYYGITTDALLGLTNGRRNTRKLAAS